MLQLQSRFVQRLLLIALLVVIPAATFAQNPLGRLTGVVRDSSDAVLPGATVTIYNDSTGFSQTEVTSESGTFNFPQLAVGSYRVVVELAGFKSQTYSQVIINVGQEYGLAVKLSIGQISETVQVTAGELLIKTTTPEVSATVQQSQVLQIPLANRDVTNLIKLQAGVAGISNRTSTTINGGRPSWTQITLDGINIQDNFIRTNALDFLPNRPTSDNVAEFSITSSVQGADGAGGATSVRMVTPSGTNAFRGALFELNRDSKFAANSFFNNASGVAKPELQRNQFGGRLGGPILKNKLFFFVTYEGFRQKQQVAQTLTIPANDDLLQGVFRYVGTDGVVRSANVMALTGLSVDPTLRTNLLSKIPSASNVNNYLAGNSSAGRLLNTAGYRFNQTDLNNRDSFTGRLDYELSSRHRFEGVFSYFKETDDRTDLDLISPDRPLVYTSSDPKRFALAWRWMATSKLQNELRLGGNLAPTQFVSDWDYDKTPVLYSTALSIINPVGGYPSGTSGTGFQPQGRYTDTYQLTETMNLAFGNHQIQTGGSWQRIRVNPYNYAGKYPIVNFGFSSAAPTGIQLSSALLPGISASDLANANALASWLGGIVTSTQQTFQVKDANSGYVAGIPSDEHYTLDNIAAYVQDNWRWKPNFTIRAGLKWEYYSPLREDNNLGFLPQMNGNSLSQVMLSPNTQITFADGDYYGKDLNNFGPTIGFAWDPTNDGKTSVRGGYSLAFVNEESVTVGRSAGRGNSGLSTAVLLSNQYATVSAGVPLPSTPAFKSIRSLADQMALSSSATMWAIDPNIRSPYVHQVSLGIQRELPWALAAEARYVGTFGRDIWRGTDYNQIEITPEFLADFKRARVNGYAAQAAGLGFIPTYNASIAGSQPLTTLPSWGLSGSTIANLISTNQVAALADYYVTSRVPGALATFMQNGGIYASQAISNGGFSDYHGLQFELRRQYKNGFMFQTNYAWSHTKTNSAGTAQNRFEAFMDNNRPELNTGRSQFHQTHVVNANAIFDLPFGQGRRWLNQGGMLNALVGNWQLSTIVAWQSGSPLSIYSGRGTFNRAGRSNCTTDPIGCNTAFSTMSAEEIRKLMGIFKTADGKIYWIDPKVIDPNTGRAVGADNVGNTQAFSGQVFFNPGAGEVGNLDILTFDGPPQTRIDMALTKRFVFGRYRLEMRGEAFNLLNNPSFYRGDMDINSTTFGRLTSVNVGARVVQLSGRFEF